MKRLLIISLIVIYPALADADSELGIALKGGGDAATSAADNRFNRYGFTGGLDGHLQNSLDDRWLFGGQLELLYTQRGAKAILDGEYLGQSRSHYLDITLALRPEVRLGPASLYVLLGGGLDILMNANKENVSGANQDITDGLHRIDVALLGGAGVALHLPHHAVGPLSLGTMFLEARHEIGLLDTDTMIGGFKNRTSSLMLGLSFVVGRSLEPSTLPQNQAADQFKSYPVSLR